MNITVYIISNNTETKRDQVNRQLQSSEQNMSVKSIVQS